MRKLSAFSLVVLGVLGLGAQAGAAITLGSNSYWSSTFACAEWASTSGLSCDGWEADDITWMCSSDSPAKVTQITSAANFAGGAGGGGYRKWLGNIRNDDSTGLVVRFPTPQREFWLRWHEKFAPGQTWAGIKEHKTVYAFTDSSVAANVNWPAGDNNIQLQPRNTMGSPDLSYTGGGWQSLFSGLSADGTWHYFEIHFILGTTGQSNGVFQMWVDGVNRVNQVGLDWFNGGAASPTGWTYIALGSNHNVSALAGCTPILYDDVAVAVPGYAGFRQDTQGRSMIGGLTSPGDTLAPAAPTNLRVQ
jgi:hypothetical protein